MTEPVLFSRISPIKVSRTWMRHITATVCRVIKEVAECGPIHFHTWMDLFHAGDFSSLFLISESQPPALILKLKS